jgi:putative DNA primase/helicase
LDAGGDDAGFDLFDEWSQRDADGYDTKAVRNTWKSVKAAGGITIETLLRMTQKHGFELPKAGVSAAGRARALWDAAKPAPPGHDYLRRKGVQPHGLREAADGWLLLPLRDADGALWNVQRIGKAPSGGADGRSGKMFLKDARVSGCWHPTGRSGGH